MIKPGKLLRISLLLVISIVLFQNFSTMETSLAGFQENEKFNCSQVNSLIQTAYNLQPPNSLKDYSRLDPSRRRLTVYNLENHCQQISPDEFWNKLIGANLKEAGQSLKNVSSSAIWEVEEVRSYFLGNVLESQVKSGQNLDSLPSLPALLNVDYKSISNQIWNSHLGYLAIASDLPFRPIISPRIDPAKDQHQDNPFGTDLLYPRRQGEFALKYFASAVLTGDGDRRLSFRFNELLSWILYSQYQVVPNFEDPSHRVWNSFIANYDTAFYKSGLKWNQLAKDQVGSFDSDYNWLWKDSTGYIWQLHEGDHHVNAIQAAALVKGFQASGDRRYLDAAENFIKYQFPRYGFHTGIWEGDRYYWTEYNPSGVNSLGQSNPHFDAVVNVQALTAWISAMVGYHTSNASYLEFARGLLWYIVKEYELQHHRTFYVGAEFYNGSSNALGNPYEMTTLDYAFQSLPYLKGKGLQIDRLTKAFGRIHNRYRYTNDWFDSSLGQQSRFAPVLPASQKEVPSELHPKNERLFQSWRVLSRQADQSVVSTFMKWTQPTVRSELPHMSYSISDQNSIVNSYRYYFSDSFRESDLASGRRFQIVKIAFDGGSLKETILIPYRDYMGPFEIRGLLQNAQIQINASDLIRIDLLVSNQKDLNRAVLNFNSSGSRVRFCSLRAQMLINEETVPDADGCYLKKAIQIPFEAKAITKDSFIRTSELIWFPQ